MNESLKNQHIQSEAMLEYVNDRIATYVIEPSIYKYAYENSTAFRNFLNNTSDEMKQYFNALRTNKRIKNFRKGFVGFAAATTIFAPFAVASGISNAVRIKKIKNTVDTPEFEDFFNFLAEKKYEGVLLDHAIFGMIYEKAKKIQED